MENLSTRIQGVFKGAGKSLYRFPSAIGLAVLLSVVEIIKIQMGWESSKNYNFLFEATQLSLLLGIVFSMSAVIFGESRNKERNSRFVLENALGIVVSVIVFLILYSFGKDISQETTVLATIARARVLVGIFIDLVVFIYFISKSKYVEGFEDAFFITQKAFVISAIYGLVIMAGVSGVLGAFQALIYRGMSYNVYQYLGVAVGLLTFTIFLGYFPSFKDTEDRKRIEKASEQTRFIFVLFDYILIPIIMALTVILLLWSVKMIVTREEISFTQLSSIASSYVIIGIWLYMMVSKHQTKIAVLYRKLYPFAGALILIFEAWSIFVQINKFGLKTAEYSFLMIWIFSLISIPLLIFLKNKAYTKIAMASIMIGVIWVLPIVGYRDATFNSQVKRLEETLVEKGLLVDGNIVAGDKEIGNKDKQKITEAVDFIFYSDKKNTPDWFKKDLNDERVFKKTFGFEKTYGEDLDYGEKGATNFVLETGVIDISNYSLSLNVDINEGVSQTNQFKVNDKNYEIEVLNEYSQIPRVKVKLDDKVIIEKDMEDYLSNLVKKHEDRENRLVKASFEDMSFILKTEDISILFVFKSIDVYYNKDRDKTEYYINIQGIYID